MMKMPTATIKSAETPTVAASATGRDGTPGLVVLAVLTEGAPCGVATTWVAYDIGAGVAWPICHGLAIAVISGAAGGAAAAATWTPAGLGSGPMTRRRTNPGPRCGIGVPSVGALGDGTRMREPTSVWPADPRRPAVSRPRTNSSDEA